VAAAARHGLTRRRHVVVRWSAPGRRRRLVGGLGLLPRRATGGFQGFPILAPATTHQPAAASCTPRKRQDATPGGSRQHITRRPGRVSIARRATPGGSRQRTFVRRPGSGRRHRTVGRAAARPSVSPGGSRQHTTRRPDRAGTGSRRDPAVGRATARPSVSPGGSRRHTIRRPGRAGPGRRHRTTGRAAVVRRTAAPHRPAVTGRATGRTAIRSAATRPGHRAPSR